MGRALLSLGRFWRWSTDTRKEIKMSRSSDNFSQTSPGAASANKALWVVVAVLGATVVGMGGYLMRGPT